jgi:transposase InsO family protein
MAQVYHSNSATNIHTRELIKKSTKCIKELSIQFAVSHKTIRKWKKRESPEDRSSRPHNIERALTDVLAALILSIRQSTWLPLDDIHDMVSAGGNTVSRSSISRLFVKHSVSKVPATKREMCKKFKEYEPGYLHIDVTYLPRFNGKKHYLFVAIDRATRLMYYRVYDAKTAENAQDFLNRCVEEGFPFVIDIVLSDNGLEFTNKLIISKKGNACTKPSKFDETCEKHGIDHRLTKPAMPKTNGMVERVNGTIKNATILRTKYATLNEMVAELDKFLIHYNFTKRHGGLQRELKVKTPYLALCKWFELKPELFYISPIDFKQKKLCLINQNRLPVEQPCET